MNIPSKATNYISFQHPFQKQNPPLLIEKKLILKKIKGDIFLTYYEINQFLLTSQQCSGQQKPSSSI